MPYFALSLDLVWPDPLRAGAYRLEIKWRGAYNLQSISACEDLATPKFVFTARWCLPYSLKFFEG